MKRFSLIVALAVTLACHSGFVAAQEVKTGQVAKSALSIQVTDIDGKKVELSKYKGKVVVIVNVASECGYTGQYKALQELYEKHGKDGLVILGFPCNDFGGQEPGSNAQIKAFAKTKFGVTFDMFAKVAIQGKQPCDLYKYLTSKAASEKWAGPVEWNFEKFILGRDGSLIGRFPAACEPNADDFLAALREALKK